MALDSVKKKQIIGDFAISGSDTGSARVQAALLTEQIAELQKHCKANPKDFSCKRGLLQAVSQRRHLLSYLQKTDKEQYKRTVEQLGLRK